MEAIPQLLKREAYPTDDSFQKAIQYVRENYIDSFQEGSDFIRFLGQRF